VKDTAIVRNDGAGMLSVHSGVSANSGVEIQVRMRAGNGARDESQLHARGTSWVAAMLRAMKWFSQHCEVPVEGSVTQFPMQQSPSQNTVEPVGPAGGNKPPR
jgi:hypothetical protein